MEAEPRQNKPPKSHSSHPAKSPPDDSKAVGRASAVLLPHDLDRPPDLQGRV